MLAFLVALSYGSVSSLKIQIFPFSGEFTGTSWQKVYYLLLFMYSVSQEI